MREGKMKEREREAEAAEAHSPLKKYQSDKTHKTDLTNTRLLLSNQQR